VVKIGGISSTFNYYDRWPEYAKMVMAQFQNNPYAPKITALREFDNCYIAIMERLVCTVEQQEYSTGEDHELFWKTQLLIEQWGGSMSYQFEEDHPELYDLILGIKSLKIPLDLHNGNAMIRKGGQLVITDPIY
jgi:hypothetical protein